MRILLIRHATTDLLGRVLYGRMPGVHLNAQGCRQAQLLAQGLQRRYRIAEVISSPMERALETARFVADEQGVTVSADEGFNEVECGSWMGKSFEELLKSDEWKTYNKLRSTWRPPGGEFIMDVQARAWSALQRIVARYEHEDATAAVISHGDVIRALLILVLGMPLDHIHRLEVAPASMSEVILGAGHPRVLVVNEIFEER